MRLRLPFLLLAVAMLLEALVGDVASVPALAGAFALGLLASPPVIVATAALTAAGLTAAANHSRYSAANDFVWYAVAIIGMPALLGRVVALRRVRTAHLRARADRLEADRDRRAHIAELEERLRLSAELQLVMAERVRTIADRATQAGPAALAAVEATARAVLADIRDVLGWLRTVPATPAVPGPAPAPASPWRLDASVALGLGVAFAAEAADASYQRGGVVLNGFLIAATVLPLAWRRRAPVPACLGTLAGMLAMTLVATPLTPLVTPIVLLVLLPYTLGARLDLKPSWLANAAAVALAAAAELLTPAAARHDSSLVALALVELAAWGAGRWVRVHDRGVAAASERAATLAAERDAAARLAVLAERARVARDLHDVTAHAMTAIVLQSGAAQRVWASDPAAARGAVDAVGRLAAEALGHLEGAEPALDLAALGAEARANGLRVSLDVDAPPVPAAVEAAAYRIVQEALTNAARHAAGAVVDVRLRAAADGLLVEVVDDGGRAGGVNGSGQGLRGMRERVEACGGRLEAGPRPDGGFSVRAVLPL